MDFLNNILKSMKKAQTSMSSEDFMLAAGMLSESKDEAREQAQNITSEKIKVALSKLKKNAVLSADDTHYLRLWIVGDAEGYTCMENSFQDWLLEFKQLVEVLSGYENKQLTLEDLFKVHGIIEDALRVSADIGNYLEKKERITKFEAAIIDEKNLDREILINILEAKIKSPRM
ncbi:MAG: hypothetical protein PHQ96_00885 [Candidatus Omnitrophica bacterium]|nr:hypothetical protein [Candidatus Omnitrophota bacterium]